LHALATPAAHQLLAARAEEDLTGGDVEADHAGELVDQGWVLRLLAVLAAAKVPQLVETSAKSLELLLAAILGIPFQLLNRFGLALLVSQLIRQKFCLERGIGLVINYYYFREES
jgi:hypothetical protein